MRPLTERRRNARDAMCTLLGKLAHDHSSVADSVFRYGADGNVERFNVEEELEKLSDNGITTPVDVKPEVAVRVRQNWAKTVAFTSIEPDLDVASDSEDEFTLELGTLLLVTWLSIDL